MLNRSLQIETMIRGARKRIENIGVRSGDAKRKEIGLAQEELDDAEEVLVTFRHYCCC